MEQLWGATQDPTQHQRWDLRFGSINYQPRTNGEPQQFTYATTVIPGVTIAGTGESLGERDRPDGTRWSGLRFWANDRRSIIKAGAGYWRYIPTEDGIRFLTRYDYRPRWGRVGEFIDKWIFRPVFGWATAWSFDRLRLWVEDGIPPEHSRDRALIHAIAVTGLAAVFAYQGIVPKLWKLDALEVAIWTNLGLAEPLAKLAVRAAGAIETSFAVITVAQSHKRWPFTIAIAAMPALALGAAMGDNTILTDAFNPASLGLAVAALGAIAIITTHGRPSGRRPLRAAPDNQADVGDLP